MNLFLFVILNPELLLDPKSRWAILRILALPAPRARYDRVMKGEL
jgi:hypothetical protein